MEPAEIKKAFRAAYEFMEAHAGEDNYERLAAELSGAMATNKSNPLACRLLSGVYDFICAEAEAGR